MSDKPTSSTVSAKIDAAAIIDAVNAVDNEAARRMVIASLKQRGENNGNWLTVRGGYLDYAKS